ncbi:MAG: glycosyltransferase family 4 protein [Ignisphaera sp.]|uniref:Glycosyltransferase n=1 Tax=Ignisphaera aggregans TaxID=334771 RepID=A0A7C4NNZ5_9CREN
MSKSVAFFATSIHKPGGAGYVERQIVKALMDLNYETYLILPDTVAMGKIEKSEELRELLSSKNVHVIANRHPLSYGKMNLFLRQFEHLLRHPDIKSLKPDIAWFMSSLPRLMVREARSSKIYVYYHMLAPWYYEIRGYYRRYRWYDLSMLYLAMNIAMNKVLTYDENPFLVAYKVLVNSSYMQLLAEKYWKKKVHVLSPPVHLNKLSGLVRGRSGRLDYVLCFGRISPEKRYEDTLKAVSMTETKPKVIIAGSIEGKSSIQYLKHLLRIAKLLSIKAEVIPNVSEKEKWELFSKATVYVHNTRAEHFGISVVEAMALGTPVIVHRSGEPYFGITNRGHYGLVYDTLEDLAKYIDELFTNEYFWLRFHSLAIKRARDYDYALFVNKLKKLLES